MKNKVYSWRLDGKLKSALEEAARRENNSVSTLLERIVTDWLNSESANDDDEKIQQQLQDAALACAGSISGEDPTLAEQASSRVLEKLKRKRAG